MHYFLIECSQKMLICHSWCYIRYAFNSITRKLVGMKSIFRIIARNHFYARLHTNTRNIAGLLKMILRGDIRCAIMYDLSFNENLLNIEYFFSWFCPCTQCGIFLRPASSLRLYYSHSFKIRLERMRTVRFMLAVFYLDIRLRN